MRARALRRGWTQKRIACVHKCVHPCAGGAAVRWTAYAVAATGTRLPARSTTSATATVASTQAEATTKASW